MDRDAFIARIAEYGCQPGHDPRDGGAASAAGAEAWPGEDDGGYGWAADAPDDAEDVVCWLIAGVVMRYLRTLLLRDMVRGPRVFEGSVYGAREPWYDYGFPTPAVASAAVERLTGGALSRDEVRRTVSGVPEGMTGDELRGLVPCGGASMELACGCAEAFVGARRAPAGRAAATWLTLMLAMTCIGDAYFNGRGLGDREREMLRRIPGACLAVRDGGIGVGDALAAAGIR